MPHKLFLTFLPVFLLSLTGCDKMAVQSTKPAESETTEQQPAQTVKVVNAMAIIDLNEVARRLGRDVALQNALKQRENQLNQELNRLKTNYQQQIQSQAESLGEDATVDQKEKLEEMMKTLNVQLVRARNTAQQQLNKSQAELLERFRNEVRPVAMEVANKRGLSVIITKNDALLFGYDPRFEITDEVVKRMSTPLVP